jgi:hypothetical protein
MAFEQTTRWWNYTPSLVERHQIEPFWRAGVAIAGLMTHVGRLQEVSVTLKTDTTQDIEETWIPLEVTLLAWLMRFQQGQALPTPTVRWQTDPMLPSSAATTLMTHLILPGQVTRALTPVVTQALWDVLHGTAEETNVIMEVLGQPTSQPPQYAPNIDAMPSASPRHLTDLVLSALQNACVDGTLEVNRYPGQVFVREEDTWVVVPKTLNMIRRWLRAKQVDLPENQVMYQSLQARGYLIGKPGQPIWKIMVPSVRKKTSSLQVLRLRNDVLWPEAIPPSFTGTELTLIPQESAARRGFP